jgi:hypothetical protein
MNPDICFSCLLLVMILELKMKKIFREKFGSFIFD